MVVYKAENTANQFSEWEFFFFNYTLETSKKVLKLMSALSLGKVKLNKMVREFTQHSSQITMFARQLLN